MNGIENEKGRRLFFTSDTWFYRDNAVEILGRKYGGTDEMNEDMIEKWNTTVGDDDVVFILGNYVYDPSKIEIVNSVLKGVKVLLPTDFDKGALMANQDMVTNLLTAETGLFVQQDPNAGLAQREGYDEYMRYKAYDSVGLNTSDRVFGMLKKKIEADADDFILFGDAVMEMPGYGAVASHYPLMDWNGKAAGTMHLHGGTVPTAPRLSEERRFNVSADMCGMAPVSYDSILRIMSKSR